MIGAMKLQPDDGPRSSLCIGPGYKRCNGISPKGLGSSLGTRWEIAGRTPEDSPQECRTLPDRRESGYKRCSEILPKGLGSSLGTRRKKTQRLTVRMPNITGLA
ncbi:hypothetical protein BHM03_00036032 [Ensete ventricosum]|nr:hypothetical protein BHM03_00036032 [Ensete ventricosum]